MIEDPTTGYILVGACAAILLVVSLFDRWLMIAVIVILGLGNQFELDLNLRIEDVSISPADVSFAIGALAAGLRLLGGGRLHGMRILWFALTLLLFSAFVRGLTTYGLDIAAASYRYWFYLTTGALFVLSYEWPPAQIDRLARFWLVLGGLLTVVILALWIDPELTPDTAELVARRFRYAYESQRLIGAATAFILAEAGLIGLAGWLAVRAKPVVRIASVVFLFMAVLLYHRSVWVAAAGGIMTLMILHRGAIPRLGVPLFISMMLLVVVALLGEGLGRDVIVGRIDSAFAEALDSDSTLNWRIRGWEALLSRALAGGPVVWLFGAGFGVSFERSFGFYTTSVSPHNHYVELFLDAGLFGLGLWLWFHARMLLGLYRMMRTDDSGFFDRRMAIALAVTMMIYCLPYSLSIDQSILLGALGALAARSAPVRATGAIAGARPA